MNLDTIVSLILACFACLAVLPVLAAGYVHGATVRPVPSVGSVAPMAVRRAAWDTILRDIGGSTPPATERRRIARADRFTWLGAMLDAPAGLLVLPVQCHTVCLPAVAAPSAARRVALSPDDRRRVLGAGVTPSTVLATVLRHTQRG